MAVPCPRCGREYDVTLFEFGRTLWCTCGARVGREARERRTAGPPQRFIADAMLGRLARWLRLLGFDCAWEPDIADETLVRRALSEGRIVLSRDRALSDEWRISGIHRIESDRVRDQLAEVLRAFRLGPQIRLLSRCSHCNEVLAPASPGDVEERVPPRVRERSSTFSVCPACRRVYWMGTHTDRIERFLADVLADAGGA